MQGPRSRSSDSLGDSDRNRRILLPANCKITAPSRCLSEGDNISGRFSCLLKFVSGRSTNGCVTRIERAKRSLKSERICGADCPHNWNVSCTFRSLGFCILYSILFCIPLTMYVFARVTLCCPSVNDWSGVSKPLMKYILSVAIGRCEWKRRVQEFIPRCVCDSRQLVRFCLILWLSWAHLCVRCRTWTYVRLATVSIDDTSYQCDVSYSQWILSQLRLFQRQTIAIVVITT